MSGQASWLKRVEERVEAKEPERRMVGATRDAEIERLRDLEVRSILLRAERDTLAQLLRERERENAELRESLARVAVSIVPAGRA